MNITNSKLLYFLSFGVILSVLIICLIFLYISIKRAKELKIKKEIINSTIKSSFIFSIAPSLPIVIALMAITKLLGKPFSYMRLSIIGSFQYELMTAKIGANSMGIENLTASSFTNEVFLNSMWIMSLSIITGMILNVFYLKRFEKTLDKAKKKDQTKVTILITSLYFGMLSIFVGPPIVSGGITLYTLMFSAFCFLTLTFIEKKFKLKSLSDFSFTISMVLAMSFAAFIS